MGLKVGSSSDHKATSSLLGGRKSAEVLATGTMVTFSLVVDGDCAEGCGVCWWSSVGFAKRTKEDIVTTVTMGV
jgi:hypothetical protein